MSIYYKEGGRLALENAKGLQTLATTAENNGQFGHACSLNILSAEEAIKACFCYLQNAFPERKFEEFDDVFKSHKIKHKNLRSFTAIHEVFLKQQEKLIEDAKGNLEAVRLISGDAAKEYELKIGKILGNVNWAIEKPFRIKDIKEAMKWWEDANEYKNDGLYVNIKKQKLISPSKFDEIIFQKSKLYTSLFIDFTEDLKKFYGDENAIKKIKSMMIQAK